MITSEELVAFIDEYGLTRLANKLSSETGRRFTPQQISHWKARGVPYRWQDLVTEISGLPKNKLVQRYRGKQKQSCA